MKFLHTSWCKNALYVWAEQSVNQADLLCEDADIITYSPFNVEAKALQELLRTILWIDHEELEIQQIEINLPTIYSEKHSFPLPSQYFLIKEQRINEFKTSFDQEPRLKLWKIDALRLTARQMVTLLSLCNKKSVMPGVFAGNDILAVKHLFRFSGALITRGCYLPSVVLVSENKYHALWLPVLAPIDVKRFNKIAEQLPGIVFPLNDRQQALELLLNSITDSIVRLSVITTLSRAQALKGKFYSVHDAWLSALRGESAEIRWNEPVELQQLCRTLDEWRYPVDYARHSNLVLRLELQEPVDKFRREWILQLKYRHNGKIKTFPFGQMLFQKKTIGEYLLLALGQAALLFSPLERILKMSDGYGVVLSQHEAHAFINQASALLRAGGYEIGLPQWCERKEIQPLALNAEIIAVQDNEDHDQSLESKFEIKWHVTLEGESVTPKELEELLKEQSSLVYFKGRWIEIDVSQLQEALRIWKRKRRETHTVREIMQMALGGFKNSHGLDIHNVRGDGWINDFLKQLQGERSYSSIKQPKALQGELRPYQNRGLSWLVFLNSWGLGACLADDMGLGKTIQTIAFILHKKKKGIKAPVLIVGPTSILGNWLHELNTFAPGLKCLIHHGAQRVKDDKLQNKTAKFDIVITSYALLHKDYKYLKKIKWSIFVADEAQNIKNALTRQAQAARAIQADYRIALTGTPMENSVSDIWALMDFLNPGLLGTRNFFRETFFKPIQSGGDLGVKNRLRKITTPFILRRIKTDREIIRDLPDKIENKVFCGLTLEQRHLYQDITENFNREIEDASGISRRGAILAVLTALKQVCNHPANYLGESDNLGQRSGKLERLVEMLDEVFQMGESALIFTQYAEMGALLKEHLCRTFAVEMPFLYGGTNRKARDIMIRKFQKSKEPSAFILSLKAGGTGLNLTRANHVFHFDRWWNPAVENQATDRAFRIGQSKNVMVHKFICAGTLEERIDELMSRKLMLTDEIVSSGEKFLTELSNSQLKQLLQLSGVLTKEDYSYE